jgi:hypothetical protein
MTSVALHPDTLSWLASAIADTDRSKGSGIESVLSRFYARLDVFQRELGAISEPRFETILLLSRETPSHYKWHLLAIDNVCMHVWLHEYKQGGTCSHGYAQSIHNHRYPMAALLLTGGYCYTNYAVQVASDNLHADVRVISTRQLSGGSVYSMTPNEFHSVTEIQDGTVSLMIQGKPVRTYSTSVDSHSLRMTRHTPIEYRLANLRSALPSHAGRSAMNERS